MLALDAVTTLPVAVGTGAGAARVDIWQTRLDLPEPRVLAYAAGLSTAELDAALRFRFPKDRKHYVVAHGFLRGILASYLGLEPGQVTFTYNAYGKPALDHDTGSHPLRFNLSHSGTRALLAVTSGHEVGVDVEQIRPGMAAERIPEQFFSPGEVAVLRSLPAHLQDDAFFACWTRKEAYIKAKGLGLSIPLDAFDVSLTPGEPAALLRVAGDAGERARWCMRELQVGAGYAAAVVAEGQRADVRFHATEDIPSEGRRRWPE